MVIEDLELDEIISSGSAIDPTEQVDAYSVTALSPILYEAKYRTAISYLRTLMGMGEHSLRSLRLTGYIIALNPAHYTVWTFRYDTLLAIHADLLDELQYLADLARRQGSKNYQLWHHRELILTRLSSSNPLSPDVMDSEKAFLKEMLYEDGKNYHVWCFRQWLNKTVPGFRGGEEEFTRNMIARDVYNNSAWNHRFFILFELDSNGTLSNNHGSQDDEKRKEEVECVKRMIDVAPDNAASWNYLKAIHKRLEKSLVEIKEFVVYFEDSLPALEVMIVIHQLEGDKIKAILVCEELQRRDSIRKKYWAYRAARLE